MSDILEALGKLYKSIDGLETAMTGPDLFRKQAAQQNDLFGGAPAFDPAMIAQSLDAMIGKLELVLKEG